MTARALPPLAFTLAFLALPALAQQEVAPQAPEFTDATGADLRFLDKLTNETGDVSLSQGQSAKFGRLIVQLDQCRYPTANPAADSEAHLTIVDDASGAVMFSGWMLASAPALSALDHPRYDVWVLSCTLPAAPNEAPAQAATPEAEGQ